MSPRKLTEDDKHNMLELYRNSKATTSTLATEFGVSSSTVSRFLKNSLSQEEYNELIQQKRLARTPRSDRKKTTIEPPETVVKAKPKQQIVLPTVTSKSDNPIEEKEDSTTPTPSASAPSKLVRRRRKRSTTTEEIANPVEASNEDIQEDLAETSVKKIVESSIEEVPSKITPPVEKKKIVLKSSEAKEEDEDDDDDVDVVTLSAMLGEEIDDDDDDDDDEDLEDRDDDDDEITYPHTSSNVNDLEILPLSAASFPRTCYLVVDRAAELIVKPLQEFADLGTIPDAEIAQKTLPVFDNHRIAKRFSHRREKVIKVPDGKMLQKTAQYLYEKGITRLLIRGQIYAISKR